MRKIHISLFLASIVGMSACTTVNYVEPDLKTTATADVRFALVGPMEAKGFFSIPYNVYVYNYSSEECKGEESWLSLSEAPRAVNPKRNLGIPLSTFTKYSAKEVRVNANTDMYFMLKSHGAYGHSERDGVFSCGVFVDAFFEAGNQYEIRFNDSDSYRKNCDVTFSKIVSKDGNVERQIVKNFSNISSTNKKCIKAFKKMRFAH